MSDNKIELEHILCLAEAFESDELSFEDAITFFKTLALLGRQYLDMLPLYYCDIIDLLEIRGDLSLEPKGFEDSQSLKYKDDSYLKAHANPKRLDITLPKFLAVHEFPNLKRAINLEQGNHSIITSPFVYSGNKADLVVQIFPRLKFQPTFVDMFGGSGVISINLVKGESFSETKEKNITNQKAHLFEYTKAMANVHSTMANIHPELCFYLVKKIIKNYELDKDKISDKQYKDLNEAEQKTYREMINSRLRALTNDFSNYEKLVKKNHASILRLSAVDRAYYDLMYFVMYRYHMPNTDIRYDQKTGKYSLQAGKSYFNTSNKFSLLIMGYRFFHANYKSFKDCPTYEMQNRYMLNNRIRYKYDETIKPHTTKGLYSQGSQTIKDTFIVKRKSISMLDKNYIPNITIVNDSSIGPSSRIQNLLKPFSDEKDRKLFYADPPYLASDISYGGGWNVQLETELLNTLDTIHANGHFLALSNVIDNAGKNNYLLKRWLFNNEHIYVSILDKDYKSTQSKEGSKYLTVEILATNYPHIGGLSFRKLTEQIRVLFYQEGFAYDDDGRTNDLNYTMRKENS
jgi:hypothetical protein